VAFSLTGTHLTNTCIYIDKYNLYYSRLKGSKFKWLDLTVLFRDCILQPQDPTAHVVAIKYFTSPVKASYARHGQNSEHAQTQYIRALTAKYPDLIEVINGFHIFQPTALPSYKPNEQPSKSAMVQVWMIEEKQTDVNIALHAYRDVVKGTCDQVVICSNDSDLEPALRMIRQDYPAVTVGLVMPLRPTAKDDGKVPNKRLTPLAHWVRRYVQDEELGKSQLPQNVQTKKKPASKPAHW
jgi:NYN domain